MLECKLFVALSTSPSLKSSFLLNLPGANSHLSLKCVQGHNDTIPSMVVHYAKCSMNLLPRGLLVSCKFTRTTDHRLREL